VNEFNKPTNQSPFSTKRYQGIQPPTVTEYSKDISLRDYFAASFVKSGHIFKSMSDGNTPELVAEQAYALADAMLKAREE
jgi:hypothetical protein